MAEKNLLVQLRNMRRLIVSQAHTRSDTTQNQRNFNTANQQPTSHFNVSLSNVQGFVKVKLVYSKTGVANIGEKIREARLRWLGHVERKTEEDVVMRRWKIVIGRPKLRWSDVIQKDMKEK